MKINVKSLIKHGAVRAVLLGGVLALVFAYGQSGTYTPSPSVSSRDGALPSYMTSDVWFWIFVGWYIFSALVTGMPEPTQDSSPWYIWAYRSFHILSASGTSFFQNKMFWPTKVEGTSVITAKVQEPKPSIVDLK